MMLVATHVATKGKLPIGEKRLVGAAGVERAASRSPSERTTRLCYAPSVSLKKRFQVSNDNLRGAAGQVTIQ